MPVWQFQSAGIGAEKCLDLGSFTNCYFVPSRVFQLKTKIPLNFLVADGDVEVPPPRNA